MTTLSLNGRSYTDLLAIQPGVIPTTTMQAELDHHGRRHRARWRRPGGSIPASSRSAASAKRANGFFVNGSDVQERMNGGTGRRAQPRLDRAVPRCSPTTSIRNTATTTAASSTSSPSRAATRSTATRFEFFRNTALDARNYFSPERAEFNQNQPGGTRRRSAEEAARCSSSATIRRTRTTQGIETGNIPVPSLAERAGNFSDVADQLTGTRQRLVLGEPAVAAARLRVSRRASRTTRRAATSAAQCVFPNAHRFRSGRGRRRRSTCCSTCRRPTRATSTFSTGAFAQTVRDDKGSLRVDGNTPVRPADRLLLPRRLHGSTIPYPGQQGGANVPGFDALTIGRAQLVVVRQRQDVRLRTPSTSSTPASRTTRTTSACRTAALGVTLASQGFVTGPGTPGIVVLAPQFEGVENLVFNTFTMGVTITGVDQTGNTLHCQRQRLEGAGARTR